MNQTQPSPPVVLRPSGPDDEQLLADLLCGLSPTTSFHRFMAGLGCPSWGLVRRLLRTGADRGAILALRPQPGGARAVGHACWVVAPAAVVDIGVVVADAEQGRGIGSALFSAAARHAGRAGATSVHLDVHPDNRRVAASLRRRLGGSAFAWEQGLLTVDAPLADVLEHVVTGLATSAA
jgi:GNAT superfamily N-acetyltransferase